LYKNEHYEENKRFSDLYSIYCFTYAFKYISCIQNSGIINWYSLLWSILFGITAKIIMLIIFFDSFILGAFWDDIYYCKAFVLYGRIVKRIF